MGTGFQPAIFSAASENILLSSLSSLMPGSTIFTEANVVAMTLSYTATGGSFSISLLKDTIAPSKILEDMLIGLPFGRTGIVKSVSSGWSTGGMVDILSGPALTLNGTAQTAAQTPPDVPNVGPVYVSLAVLANQVLYGYGGGGIIGGTGLGYGNVVEWAMLVPFIKHFAFRGQALAGLQQIASIMLADLIVRKDGYHFVNAGAYPNVSKKITISQTDVINANQAMDYSSDVASILNPTLLLINTGLPQQFVYDYVHAQKQPKFTVSAGAPSTLGATDFIPIPDGWLVDGNYEEWTPANPSDLTNPNASVTNGRYWKQFPSPTNPNMMRGITNFTRLVKQIVIPGNVSSFIGSPITGLTKQGGPFEFAFNDYTSNQGIYGLDSSSSATGVTLFDIISHQFLTFPNAIVLIPQGGGTSGDAASSFYSITMEQWTFPLVNPQTFTLGTPLPPSNVAIVTPNSNIQNGQNGYWLLYLYNYQKLNSPRLRTSVAAVYRNTLPEVGDHLFVNGLTYADCGRIQTVNVSFSRTGGVVLNLTAELYQAKKGKWSLSPGGAVIGGGLP